MDPSTSYCFAAIGGLMGLHYVSSSWRGKSATGSFKDDPRVKGLLWGFSTAALILIADWDRFLPTGGSTAKSILLASYAVGFVVGVATTLSLLLLAVMATTYRTNREYPSALARSGASPVVDFVLYGYRDYQDKLSKAISDHESSAATTSTNKQVMELQEELAHRDLELKKQREFCKGIGEVVVASLDLHRAYISGTIQLHEAAKGLLRNILPTVAYHTGMKIDDITINYMVLEDRRSLSAAEIEATRFTFGDLSRYQQFLSLKGSTKRIGETIRLGIEPVSDESSRQRTLPGAPRSILEHEAVEFRVRGLEFAPEVPLSIQRQILAYFQTKGLEVVISLPLVPTLSYTNEASPVGVLNIDLQKNGKSAVVDIQELEALVLPYAALLADAIISHAKERN